MRGCRSRPLAVLRAKSGDAAESKKILWEVSTILHSVAACSWLMTTAL